MNDTPAFSRLDVDRVLRRAAEIEGSEGSGPITADELRAIAGEAGFGRHAVERAITEARDAAVTEVRRQPVRRVGIVVTHLSAVRTVPIEVSTAQMMRAVRLFQPYREGPAQVKLEEDQIRWRDRRGLQFIAMSQGGSTEIRVHVSGVLFRRGRWIGWVKAAADRLEALVLLVANEGASAVIDPYQDAPQALPHSRAEGA